MSTEPFDNVVEEPPEPPDCEPLKVPVGPDDPDAPLVAEPDPVEAPFALVFPLELVFPLAPFPFVEDPFPSPFPFPLLPLFPPLPAFVVPELGVCVGAACTGVVVGVEGLVLTETLEEISFVS